MKKSSFACWVHGVASRLAQVVRGGLWLVVAGGLVAALQAVQIEIPAEAADGAVVTIADGVYEPLDLQAETRTLTLRAATRGGVVIDGGNVARCATLPETITLDGFVLQHGKAECGGGVRGGTVVNAIIQDCSATFGGGAYQTKVIASIVRNCTAEFFGTALYEGSAFSCRIECNGAADYGAGMAALFGTVASNCAITGNTTPRDTAGTLLSPVQNMIYFGNRATRGSDVTVNRLGVDFAGGVPAGEDAFKVVREIDFFTDAANGDYSLNLDAASAHLKELGDPSLGGYYDELWHKTDLAGRNRLLGQVVDIGPYEIGDTLTPSCTVIGAGAVTITPAGNIQEGDTVLFTATPLIEGEVQYARDFLGFYVNGQWQTADMNFSWPVTATDRIEARFAGLRATPETLEAQIAQLHPTRQEVLTLEAGEYTLAANEKPIVYQGVSPEQVRVTLTGDMGGATILCATVAGTATQATLHRCVVDGLSGSEMTLTSSILKSSVTALAGTAVNVTAFGSWPETLKRYDCVMLAGGEETVAGAILPQGSTEIDAGVGGSGVVPFDDLDIAGRPRTMGKAIDRGAHECYYTAFTVAAVGAYESLSPAVGTQARLAGDVITLAHQSARDFLGWTLNGEALGEVGELVIPELPASTLTATFAGFTLASGDAFPAGTTAQDTIVLAPGGYAWSDVVTEATIVGTGVQGEVFISGSISGGRFEAVTMYGADLTGVTLNRCLVMGGSLVDCQVVNSVLTAGTMSGASSTYINNTIVSGVALPEGAVNTRTVSAPQADYTLAPGDEAIDAGTELTAAQLALVGDLDYAGQARINNGCIDLGAAEYVWPPQTVILQVSGHGLVSPRGEVQVVRGQTLFFTATEDPKHLRGEPVVVGAEAVAGRPGVYAVTPTEEVTEVTIAFAGLTVGAGTPYATVAEAIAEAQDGETLTLKPGLYNEMVDVKNKRLRLVAEAADPRETIIDAGQKGRAVSLVDGAEIIGMTVQGGVANEGAGVLNGTVRRCIVRNNALTYNGFGGGVCNVFAESCLLYDNGTAALRSAGGGAANSHLLNCTVARNVAEKGGGLYDCTAKNCVIALNRDGTGATSDWVGDSVDPDPSDCCTPTSGGIAVDAEAIFVEPAADDFRLREGIACIDRVSAGDFDLSAEDLLGHARQFGEAVDMGAIEWDSPDYVMTLTFNCRAQATLSINGAEPVLVTWDAPVAERTFVVPRMTTVGERSRVVLTWANADGVSTVRTLKGIALDGALLDGSETATTAFDWEVGSADTVNVRLTFVADALTIARGDAEALTKSLSEAIAGETIYLESGAYDTAVVIGEGVTLVGAGADESTLLQGATLADGANLTGATVSGAAVVGPASGSATLQHCIVTGVADGAAVRQEVTLKVCLLYANAAGLGEGTTAYLTTVADTAGTALAATAKAYGCAVWRYGTLAEDGAETVDCVLGGDPRFVSPAPAGCDYRLSARSPLIDAAGEACWPGFTSEDRALTDLAGLSRNQLLGFDCGAYEYQASATPSTWTWFGSDSSMDGDFAGAGWRQIVYGAPQKIPAGVSALLADRAGFTEASLTLGAGELTLASLEVRTTAAVRLLPGSPVGRIILNGALTKNAAGSFTVAVPLDAQGNVTFSVGETRLLEGADLRCGGTLTVSGTGTRLEQHGGTLAFGNFLNVRGTANVLLADGLVTGGEISVAQGDRTAVTFAGATVTATRIETGDEGGARSGHVLQTGGVVTLTGSGVGKGAPLHIAHWSGSSSYTLRGGELWVPNGEVRLGTDGTGTLRLEGGTANIRSMTIASGALQLAGGTFHALETQTIAPVFIAGTQSMLTVAEGKRLTFANANHATHTGDLVLGAGDFTSSAVISGRHLTLSAGTSLTGHVDLGAEQVLTLPVEGEAPLLTGDLRSGALALAGEMPRNVSRTVLKVTGAVPENLKVQNADCYTLEKQTEGTTTLLVLTQTSALPPEEPTPDRPVLTVASASESWANAAAWSTDKVPVAETPVLVKAIVDATLTLPAETLADVTFEVAEGKRLTLAAVSGSAVTALRLVGPGTLSLGSAAGLAYSTQAAFAGTLVIESASQTLTAETMKSQHLRFETTFALGSCYGFTFAGGVEVADGCQLTCNSSVAGGEVLLEQNTTFVIGNGCTNRFNLTGPETGAVTLQVGTSASHAASYGGMINVADWSIGGSGASTLKLTGAVRLATPPKAGTLMPNSLTSLDIGSGVLALGSPWAMPAGSFKSGAGTLVLAAGSSIAGAARIEGSITLAGDLSASAPLRLAASPHVTLPAGARIASSSDLVLSPGTRVVLTGDLTALPNGDYPLFTTSAQGGLYLASMADVRVEAEALPEGKTVTLTPYLRDDTFGYTLSTQVPNRWTGNGADSRWSTPENWSDGVPEDGVSLIFPKLAEAARQTVTLDGRVAPKAVSIEGDYTFAGAGTILGVPAISQSADTSVTWACFPAAGSYVLATNAVARVTAAAQYEGTLLGAGTLAVAAELTLCNEAVNFTGALTVEDGGHLRLAHPLATGACPVQLTGGALTSLQPMTIADLTLSETAQLNLSAEAPLTVSGTLTGEVVSIAPMAVPSEVGTWELIHLPDATPRTLRQLAYTEVEAERLALLQQDEQRILLQVVTIDTLEWAGRREDGQEAWFVKGTTTAIDSAENKTLWFGDVAGVTEATVALPAGTQALYVTVCGETALTLTGTLAAPLSIESGASVTLSGAMTPTEMRNYGTLTVAHGTLDLTQATSLYGTGVYIIGEGGILKLKPQQLAESTATFRPAGGAIELVTAEDFHYPDNRMPSAIETLSVGGSGKLYLSAFSFPAQVRVQNGATLLPEGAQGLKARYVKLEVRERFEGDAILMGNLRLMRDGQLCPWPEGTHIVRFDSGHSNKVQVGLSGTTDRLNFGSGTLEALCSNDDWMYASWSEAGNVTTYGGANEKRLFFVVDTGAEGIVFSEYAVTQTSNLGSRLWTLSLANDLSNWHPTTDQLGPMTHESSVWQDVDILRSPPLELNATWEFPVGRTSALWSALSSTVLLEPEATLDLSGATVRATLADWLEIDAITGDAGSCIGTLRLPTSLNLTVGTLAVDTLAMIGDRVRDRPIHARSAADFKRVTFSLEAANAYVAAGTTEFALCDNFTGAEVPALDWPEAANTPIGGGTWQLALRNGVLYLDLVGAKSELVAELDDDIAWEAIRWKDLFGVEVDLSADEWRNVRHLILRVSSTLTLSDVPDLPANCAVTLDFLSAEDQTLTLSATAARTLPPITVSGTTGGNLLVAPDSADIALSDIRAATDCPYFGASPELLDTLSGVTLDFDDEATIGLLCAEAGSTFASLRTVRAAVKGFAIRSGTLKMRKVDTFGGEVENTKVRVDAGATLDVDGYPTSCALTLNGGTLRNSGSQNNNDVGTSKRQLYNITLAADSTIESLRDFNSVQHYYNRQALTLNGYILTKRGSGTFGLTNADIIGGGCIRVEAGTLRIQANDSPPETTLSGDVTFENAGGTFTVAKAYTLADDATLTCKGNVSITGALTAGERVTLAYDGNVIPPAIASLNRCATLTFSESFWQAVEGSSAIASAGMTIVTNYGGELPLFTARPNYALVKDGTALKLRFVGTTAVKAVVGTTAKWSELAWMNPAGQSIDPDWAHITSVTLEADAAATLEMDSANLPSVYTLIASQAPVMLTGEAWDVGTLALKGPVTIARPLASGALTIASGTTTLTSDTSTFTGSVAIAAGARLKATSPAALAFLPTSNGSITLGAANLPLSGAGTLELAMAAADVVQMSGSTSVFSGDILVSSGKLKFPSGGQFAPIYGRIITVQGADSELLTGTATDATGWNAPSGRQKLVLNDGAIFRISKRDSFGTPLEMCGGTICLMSGAQDSNRGFDIYKSPKTTIKAKDGEDLTISRITYDKVGTAPTAGDRTVRLREGNWTVDIDEGAQLAIDATLNMASSLIKTDAGDLLLAATNSGSGAITVNNGSLTLTGTTGTGTTTLKADTILRGTGRICGDLTMESGAILEVSPMEGHLQVDGALTLPVPLTLRLVGDAPVGTVALLSAANLPSVDAFTVDNLPSGYTLTVVGQTLYAESHEKPAFLQAEVTASSDWDSLPWRTLAGEVPVGPIDWAYVVQTELKVSASATLSEVPALAAAGDLIIAFTAAEEQTLTLSATAARTLPPITVSGTTGGNLLVAPDSADIALTSLSPQCPYLGASLSLLATLWNGQTAYSLPQASTVWGLFCAEGGSSVTPTLTAASGRIRLRAGLLKATKANNFGLSSDDSATNILQVDTGATFDLNGYESYEAVVLNGGALQNSGSNVETSKRQSPWIELLADSIVNAPAEHHSIVSAYNKNALTLNGHTLTKRGGNTFGIRNADISNGTLRVEAGTLQLSSSAIYNKSTIPETTLSGDVTFENAGGTFTVAKAYTLADAATLTCKGNVSIIGALTAGENVTLAYDGNVIPPAIASLNRCATLTFSESFWHAVEVNTSATGVTVTLVTAYASDKLPAFTSKEGYALEKVNGALVVTYSGALSEVTALKASVTGDAKWSELAWHDATTDEPVANPMWGVVTSVSLEAAADATVSLDLPLARLTALTVAASAHTLTLSGESANLKACAFATFAVNGRLVLKAGVLSTIPDALSGTAEIVFDGGTISAMKGHKGTDKYAYHDFKGRWVVETGTTLRLASTTENTACIMNWDENVNGTSGQIEVRNGAVLEVTQKNAFGWGNVTALQNRTMLVVDGGLVRVSATAEEYFRRKMVWRNGATLEHTGSGDLFFTRGCTMVIEGDTTFRGPKPFILRSDVSCNNATSTTFAIGEGATLRVEGQIQSDASTDNRLVLSGAGRVLFNGENSYARATTVGSGTTIGGTGAITSSAVTFAADGTSQLLVDPFASKPLTLSGTLTNAARLTLACDLPTAEPMAALTSTNAALSVDNFSAPDHYELSLSEDAQTLFLKRKLLVVYDENAPESALSSSASQKIWQAVIEAVERQQLTDQVAGEVKTKVEIYDASGSKKREESRAEVLDAFLSCFVNHASAAVETAGEAPTATVKICCDFGISHITLDANHDVLLFAKVEGTLAGSVDFADNVAFSVVDEITGKHWQVDAFESTATGEVRFTIPANQLDDTASEKLLEGFIGTRALKVHVQKKL